jgi:hypothetical protein
MGACALAAVAWGLSLRADAPAAFAGANGIASSSLAASWTAIVAAMVACTTVAGWAALGARRAPRPLEA